LPVCGEVKTSQTCVNDLTYFIVAQTKVIRQAINELHAYIDRKTEEFRKLEKHVRDRLAKIDVEQGV
jgi:Fic family protein